MEKGKKSADRRKGRVGDANSAFNKVSHGCHLNTVAYSLFSSRLAIIEEESESREREGKKNKRRKGGREEGRKKNGARKKEEGMMKGEEEKGERRIALPPLDDSPDVGVYTG